MLGARRWRFTADEGRGQKWVKARLLLRHTDTERRTLWSGQRRHSPSLLCSIVCSTSRQTPVLHPMTAWVFVWWHNRAIGLPMSEGKQCFCWTFIKRWADVGQRSNGTERVLCSCSTCWGKNKSHFHTCSRMEMKRHSRKDEDKACFYKHLLFTTRCFSILD